MVVDFHNHLMPGVDDGAADAAEALAGLSALAADGATAVISTPHFRGSLTLDSARLESSLQRLDAAWELLLEIARAHHADIRMYRGVELMLDHPFPVLDDPRLRLAGSQFVLVEFPYMQIPAGVMNSFEHFRRMNFRPIVAHPERYGNVRQMWSELSEWKRAGAALQVNSGSLAGYYGEGVKRIAWEMLECGLADYLSSDYHARGKLPTQFVSDIMRERNGSEIFDALTSGNPARIIQNQLPLKINPLGESPQRVGILGQLRSLFRSQ